MPSLGADMDFGTLVEWTVKPGDRVNRGQVLGVVGNSGNSTEPHLHFHVGDTASPLDSEGLPYAISGMIGIPLQNAKVTFPK